MHAVDVAAVVTGGASGLGEATVRALVASGGRAVILDRDCDRGQALAIELGPDVTFVDADVTSDASVGVAFAAARVAMGPITVCVNCAGIAVAEKTIGKDGAHDLERYRQVIDVNLTGTFNVLRIAAAAMAENKPTETGERGVIVNTASIAAFDGQKGQVAYAASKGGIAAMTLPVARDLARDAIRICTIAPGLFLTPMFDDLGPDVCAELAGDVIFPKRLGDPAEFARTVRFIVENPYMNGETIRLDGALRMR